MSVNEFKAEKDHVTVLVLVSGHNLLGRVAERTEDHISLLRIVHFQIGLVGPRQFNVEFATFQPMLCVYDPDKPLAIKLAHVLHEYEPARQLADQYTEATTGVKVASQQDLAAVAAAGRGEKGPNIPGFSIEKR